MTVARTMPNNCIAAINRSAELAVAGKMSLRPIIFGKSNTQEEMIRRVAMAQSNFEHIARILERIGAKSTDPIAED